MRYLRRLHNHLAMKNKIKKKAMEETHNKALTRKGLLLNVNSVWFCDELIREILIRLTAKPLFRSKCVCTRWLHLISDPFFLNSFIQRSKSLPPLISGFFYDFRTDRSGPGKPKFLDTATNKSSINNHPFTFLTCVKGRIEILDSSNGLLLCREKPKPSFMGIKVKPHFTSCLIVCNPVTKQWVALPETRELQTEDGIMLSTYNLDKLRCEFVVVCLTPESLACLQVHKYSSETGIWEEYKVYGHVSGVDRAVFLNDCVYWLDNQSMVSVYNLNGNQHLIGLISFPRGDCRPESSKLQVSSGCLLFIESTPTMHNVWVLVNGVKWEWKHQLVLNPKVDLFAIHPLDCNLIFLFKFKPSRMLSVCRKDRGEWRIISDHRLQSPWCIYPGSSISVKIVPYFLPAWPSFIPRISNN